MLGWMLIFALMLLVGAVGPVPGMTSSLVFGLLLVLSALALFLRGRA
jgi:hypothetical protein